MQTNQLQIAIYVSAVMIAIGVFLPLAELPVYGVVTYNRVAPPESYVAILCALSAPVLLFIGQKRLTIISAIALWVALLFPALKGLFKSEGDSGLLGDLAKKAASPLQEYAADLFMNVTDFSWGGLIFILGVLIFTVACVWNTVKAR